MSSTYSSGLFVPATDYGHNRPGSVGRSSSAPRGRAGSGSASYLVNQVADASRPRSAQRSSHGSEFKTGDGGYRPGSPGAVLTAAFGPSGSQSGSRLGSGSSQSHSHMFGKTPALAAAAAVYGGSSRPQSAGASMRTGVSKISAAAATAAGPGGPGATAGGSTSGAQQAGQAWNAQGRPSSAGSSSQRQQQQPGASYGYSVPGHQPGSTGAGSLAGQQVNGAGSGAGNQAAAASGNSAPLGKPLMRPSSAGSRQHPSGTQNQSTGAGTGAFGYGGTEMSAHPYSHFIQQQHTQQPQQQYGHAQGVGTYPLWAPGGQWASGGAGPSSATAAGGQGAATTRPSSAGTRSAASPAQGAVAAVAAQMQSGNGGQTAVVGSSSGVAGQAGVGSGGYTMGHGFTRHSGPVVATAGALGPAAAAMFLAQQQQQQQAATAKLPTGVMTSMPAQAAGTYVSYSSTTSTGSSGSAGASAPGGANASRSTGRGSIGSPGGASDPGASSSSGSSWNGKPLGSPAQAGSGSTSMAAGTSPAAAAKPVGFTAGLMRPGSAGAGGGAGGAGVTLSISATGAPISANGVNIPPSTPIHAAAKQLADKYGATAGVTLSPTAAERAAAASGGVGVAGTAMGTARPQLQTARPGSAGVQHHQHHAAAAAAVTAAGYAGVVDEEDGDDLIPLTHAGHGQRPQISTAVARGGDPNHNSVGDGDGEGDDSPSASPYEAAMTPHHGHGHGQGQRPGSAKPGVAGTYTTAQQTAALFASPGPVIGPGIVPPSSGLLASPLNLPQPVMPDFSHLPPEEAEVARKSWQRQVQREREWVARQRLKQIVAHPDFDGRATTEFYGFGKVLGQGSFGEVRLAWHRLAGAKVAIKSYEKARLTEPNHWRRVQQEIRLMERLNHPNIIRQLEMIDSVKRIHIVMEYAGGGNLCSYVKSKSKLSEQEARKHFIQLLAAVEYMHDLGIIHRDIKLENVLFDEEQANVKLTDFGFSVAVRDPNKRLKIFCGTPSYMAPEITQRKEYLGRPVDVWSLAVLLYAMLAGHFPFTAKTYPELYKKIAAAQLKFPDHMSSAVRDLLRRMLHPDPVKRLTLAHARMHPWVAPSLAVILPPPGQPGDKSLLISDEPSRDVNEAVLQRCEHLGFKRQKVLEAILSRAKTAASTAYYLVLARMGRSAKVGAADGKEDGAKSKEGRGSGGVGGYGTSAGTGAVARPSTAGAPTRASAAGTQAQAHARAVTAAQMTQPTGITPLVHTRGESSAGSATSSIQGTPPRPTRAIYDPSSVAASSAGSTASRDGPSFPSPRAGGPTLGASGTGMLSGYSSQVGTSHGSLMAGGSGKLDDGSRASSGNGSMVQGLQSRAGSIQPVGPQAGVAPSSFDDGSRVSGGGASAFAGRFGRGLDPTTAGGSMEAKDVVRAGLGTGTGAGGAASRSRSAGPAVAAATRPRSAAPGLGPRTAAVDYGGGVLAGTTAAMSTRPTAGSSNAGSPQPVGAPGRGPVRATPAALPHGIGS